MHQWAIVPVKRLTQSKSRLAPVLAAAERVALMHALLENTLRILTAVPQLERALVVSRDPAVLTGAGQYGALTLSEPEGAGLNGAVSAARAHAAEHNAARILVIPADLPFLNAADVTWILAQGRAYPAAVIACSDRRGEGTNALSVPTTGAPFRFQYGRGSFGRHQREAARLGRPYHVVHLPKLQFDLDTPQDWRHYNRSDKTTTNAVWRKYTYR